MKKHISLLILLFSNCSLSCDDLEIPQRMEWSSNNEKIELFISVPEYYKEHKYVSGTLTSGKIQVALSFTRIDYIGWVSTTVIGSKEFFNAANLSVNYKKLDSYNKESNSFSFVGCYAEYNIELKTMTTLRQQRSR